MIFSNDPAAEIARAFTNPDGLLPDKRRPLLFLLRRDLQNQYGKEGAPPGQLLSPLLTGLGIMVGFEVLTKLWSGDHKAGTPEIEDFLREVGQISESHAIALAQFRHALAHGYRLQTVRKKDQETYSFKASDDASGKDVVRDLAAFEFEINLWRLKDLFISAISRYHELLQKSSDLQAKFMVAKANIGEIEIVG